MLRQTSNILKSTFQAAFPTRMQELHVTSVSFSNGKCDSGKCKKKEILMKQVLNSKESNYLQPSKKQVSVDQKFKEAKPIIKPQIDLLIEKNCRIMEECNKTKGKGDKKPK